MMLSGSLTYASYIEGIEFEKFEIMSADANVSKVEIASDEMGQVTIKVHVEKVPDQGEAEALGLREATRIINILAIEQGKYVTDPRYKGHTLNLKQA